MADDVLIKLGFNFDPAGIRRARQAVEKALSGIKLDIDPRVRSAVKSGSPGRVVGSSGAFQGDIAKLGKQSASLEKKLIAAKERRVATEEKIAKLQAKASARGGSLAKKQQDELDKLIRSLRSQKGAITKFQAKLADTTHAGQVLSEGLRGAATAVVALGSGGVQIVDTIKNTARKLNDVRSSSSKFAKETNVVTQLLTERASFISKQTRVGESFAQAQQAVITSFTEQHSALAKKLRTDEALTAAEEKVVAAFETEFGSITALTRPLEAVKNRAEQLSIRFGEGGKFLAAALEVTRGELAAAANKFEGNLSQVVGFFRPEAGGDAQDEREAIIKQATSVIAEEIASGNAVVKANKQYAAKQSERTRDRGGQIGEAEKTIIDALREVAKEALVRGDSLGTTLENISQQFGGQLGTVPVEIARIFNTGSKTFLKSLLTKAKDINEKIDIDSVKAQLIQRFGLGSGSAAVLIQKFEEDLAEVRRKAVDKAEAEAVKSAAIAREISELREARATSEKRLLESIEDAVNSQELVAKKTSSRDRGPGGSGGGESQLKRVRDEASSKLRSSFGKIVNALSTEEKTSINLNKNKIRNARREIKAITNLAKERENQVASLRRQAGAQVGAISGVLQTIDELEAAIKQNIAAQDKIESSSRSSAAKEQQIAQIEGERVRLKKALQAAETRIVREELELFNISDDLKSAERSGVELQQDLNGVKQKIISSEQEIERITQRRLARAQREPVSPGRASAGGGGGGGGGGVGLAAPSNLAQINKLAKDLDTSSLARLVKILKEEDVNIKKVNASLKNHQGNIAKSSSLVDKLTVGMNSGQKAAFQFGFAAASAAERLTAWASPAAVLFSAVQLLKEAVQTIVQLDSQAAKLAFFQPQVLNNIAAGLDDVTLSTNRLALAGDRGSESFSKLGSIQQKQRVIAIAASQAQDAIIDRSIKTGITIERLTEIATTAGRVGQQSFERIASGANKGQLAVSEFAKSIELLSRFEGASFNAEKTVANLNAALNIFGEEASRSTVLVSQLAASAGNAGLSADELLEAIVRSGAALREFSGASFEEALVLATKASQNFIPSASQIGTILKQINTNGQQAVEVIKEFSGIDIAEGGTITLDRLLLGLEQISKQGGAAKVALAAAFSDKKIRAGVLSLAQNAGAAREEILELRDPALRAQKTIEGLEAAFAASAEVTTSFESELTKLSSSLVKAVKASDALGVPKLLLRGGTGAVELTNKLDGATDGVLSLKNIFLGLAAVALPTLSKIAAGFKAGFLSAQIKEGTLTDINQSLNTELGLAEGIKLADQEGVISAEKLAQARKFVVDEITKVPQLQRKVASTEKEIELLLKEEKKDFKEIDRLRKQNKEDETEIAKILEKERNISKDISKDVNARAKATSKFSGLFKSAGAAAGGFAAQAISTAIVNSVEDPQTKKATEAGLQGLLAGAATGFVVGGPFGAAVGAAVGGLGGLGVALLENDIAAGELAEKIKEVRKQAEISKGVAAEEAAFRAAQAAKVGEAAERAAKLQAELLEIEKEIRIVGAERAKEEGLITQQIEKSVQVRRALLQAGEEQLENQKSQEELQRRLVTIAQQKLQLEKSIEVVRAAQLNLLRGQGNFELEAQLNFKFDIAQIENTRRELQEQLAEIVIEAKSSGTAEQRRVTLAKSEAQVREKLVNLEFDVLKRKIDAQREILDASEASANKQIDAWKSAASSVTDAFSQLVDAQSSIAGIISEQSELINSIFDAQLKEAEQVLKLGTSEILGDDVLGNLPKELQAAVLAAIAEFPGQPGDNEASRQAFLERQFSAAQSARAEQTLANVRNVQSAGVPSADDILNQARNFVSALTDADIGISGFTDNLTLEQKNLVASLQIEKETIDANIQARETFIKNEIDSINNIITAKNAEVDAIVKAISASEERAEKDIAFAEKLVNAPDEILKNIGKIASAQNFFSNVDFSKGIANALGGLSNEVNRVRGNRAAAQEILEGLQAADASGEAVVAGVDTKKLLTIFSQLLTGRDVDDAKKLLEEGKKQVGGIIAINKEIGKLRESQLKLTNAQIKIASGQEIIANQQKIIDEQAREELAKIAVQQIEATKTLREDFIKNQETIASLEEKLINKLGSGFVESVNGIFKVEKEVKRVGDILKDIADADSGTSKFTSLKDELEGLLSGDVTSLDGDAVTRLLTAQLTKLSAIENDRLQRIAGDRKPERTITPEAIRDELAGLAGLLTQRGIIGSVEENLKAGKNIGGTDRFERFATKLGVTTTQLARVLDKFDTSDANDRDEINRVVGVLASRGTPAESKFDTRILREAFKEEAQAALASLLSGDLIAQRVDELKAALPESTVEDIDRSIETEQAGVELQKQAVETQKELLKDGERTRVVLDGLSQELSDLLSSGSLDISSLTSVLRERFATGTSGQRDLETGGVVSRPQPFGIDPDSLFKIKEEMSEVFVEAAKSFNEQFKDVLKDPLQVNFGELAVKLNAQVLQQLQGEEFAAQIANALAGSGLEGQVELIQRVLANLVQTELERGNPNVPVGALDELTPTPTPQ